MAKKPNEDGHVAQNGDVCGRDNDGDGRRETIYVRPSKNGTRSHYRTPPKN